MAIPRKVKEAADKAEALYAQAYQQPEEPVEQAPIEAAQPEPAPVTDAPYEQPVTEVRTEPPADDRWEHKFKVIEGKYKAEVPRLAAQVKELSQRLESLSAENDELKSRAQTPAKSLISQEDHEKYGDDLIDVIRRAAKEESAAKEAEITALKRQLESITSTTAKQTEIGFYDRLSQLVPNWVAINDDSEFHQWLDEYDELTGKRRQDLLSEAEASKDADRVARFFSKWDGQKTQSKATTQMALASQVAPDSSRVIKAPTGKRYFTRNEISNFYAKARRGEISQRDLVAMETEIHAASIEGRVR
jgi:uncharacterized phage infection (PIP) family protein YhgE